MRSLIADLDGIVWEADARTMLFTFVSGGSIRILGYTPQEWLAEPTFWADRIHPDDRERMIAQFVRAATAGWSFDAEYRVRAKDGSVVWLRDVGHVVRDAEGRPTLLRGLMVDVTKQRLVEDDRRSAEERFRAVVERLPAIVYLEAIEEMSDAVAHAVLTYAFDTSSVTGDGFGKPVTPPGKSADGAPGGEMDDSGGGLHADHDHEEDTM